MHAEKCPICEGRGHLGFVEDAYQKPNSTADAVCHGCGGEGWVEVNDSPQGWISHAYEPSWPPHVTITWDQVNFPATKVGVVNGA